MTESLFSKISISVSISARFWSLSLNLSLENGISVVSVSISVSQMGCLNSQSQSQSHKLRIESLNLNLSFKKLLSSVSGKYEVRICAGQIKNKYICLVSFKIPTTNWETRTFIQLQIAARNYFFLVISQIHLYGKY